MSSLAREVLRYGRKTTYMFNLFLDAKWLKHRGMIDTWDSSYMNAAHATTVTIWWYVQGPYRMYASKKILIDKTIVFRILWSIHGFRWHDRRRVVSTYSRTYGRLSIMSTMLDTIKGAWGPPDRTFDTLPRVSCQQIQKPASMLPTRGARWSSHNTTIKSLPHGTRRITCWLGTKIELSPQIHYQCSTHETIDKHKLYSSSSQVSCYMSTYTCPLNCDARWSQRTRTTAVWNGISESWLEGVSLEPVASRYQTGRRQLLAPLNGQGLFMRCSTFRTPPGDD